MDKRQLIAISINSFTFDIEEEIIYFEYSKTGSIKIVGRFKDKYIPINKSNNYTLVILNKKSKMIFIDKIPDYEIAKPIFLKNILDHSIHSINILKKTVINGEKRIQEIKKMLNII